MKKIIDMDIKYKTFTVEKFLQDDFFIHSIRYPSAESDQFWNKMIHEGNLNLHDYYAARNLILSVQVQPETLSSDEKQVIWKRIQSDNSLYIKKKSKQKSLRRIIIAGSGIAATVAILLVLNVFSRFGTQDQSNSPYASIESIAAPDNQSENKIQLIVNNDKSIVIDGENAKITYNDENVTIENEQIASKNESLPPSVVFNQLIVPFGKRSTLILADGSEIWVNAGTRVVYPSAFAKDKREIYVDGEIFADITHNENWPFVVKTKNLSAEVLGTSFNVNAYESDNEESIVLVTGKLRVNTEQGNTILAPNQMLSKNEDNFQVSHVDTYDYTAWKDGMLQYHSESMSVILKRLSRYYGKEIECSTAASDLKCSGKLLLKNDLQSVLNCIALTAPIGIRTENEKYIITYK